MPINGSSSSRIDSNNETSTSHKDRGFCELGILDAAAGPSEVSTPASTKLKTRSKSKRSGAATPIPQDEHPSPFLEEPSFENNGDFIAFGLDMNLSSDNREPQERDWDKGKGKVHESDGGGGKKGKADIDRNDGYNNKKDRMDAASRKAPWVTDVNWEGSTNVAELLHQEVKAFVNYISPTREEDEVRSLVVTLISQAIQKKIPDAKVLAFGSYETKLYLPLGDIDLVVLSQSMAYSDRITVLHALANTLKRAGITDKVTIIAKAKVPIVKFVTTHGYFPVDISINQENGVEAGRVVTGFLSEMPALRALVLVGKAFLSQRSMNEVFSGGLGSYSIVCLAASFLQMHPKIRRGEINPAQNLGVLVMEFFELYGCYFNYHEVGISLRDGGTYFNKAQRGWVDYRQSLLSIEDPADPANDISKGSYNIARVRQTFAGAHGIMTAAAYLKAGILNSRRSGRFVQLRGHVDPPDLSILSSVLGVTQETINRRRIVQEVYDKKVLHRLVGVSPRATVVQDVRHLKNATRRKRGDAFGVQTAWESRDRSRNSDGEGPTLATGSTMTLKDRSGEIIDVDAETSRYGIRPRKRRRISPAIDEKIIFTTDEGSEEEEILVVGSSEEGIVEFDHTESARGRGSGRVKINRKRAFWASKGRVEGSPLPLP
ncbi:hypothetical protein B0F90DRAFT_1808312 [Multifurca ochricompacta]|uniref:polynucleotide adenylyltransferase n=1 Tax=Multifurca ochricompacta TaxID=376703 RepID=A0AAD4QS90_9AGAM|nr:hypothetical protein B0F90DRAFT_1808312 [Multifurca ochricompacta]